MRYYVEHTGSDGPGVPGPCVGHCGTIEHAGLPELANWPDSCRLEITVSYQIDQIPLDLWERSLGRALLAWEQVIAVKFKILPRFTQSSRIWITDAPLPGSTLAWSFLANNSCSANLEQRYDTLVDWSFDYLTATIVHEIGHALGLKHSNSKHDIMYPSITMNTVAPAVGDVRQAVRLGYDEQTEPPQPQPPKPQPPKPQPPEKPDMDWVKIIEIVLEVIKECQENRGRDETRKTLRAGGFRVALPLRRALRRQGLKGADLKAAVEHALEDLAAASDAELAALLDDAASSDAC